MNEIYDEIVRRFPETDFLTISLVENFFYPSAARVFLFKNLFLIAFSLLALIAAGAYVNREFKEGSDAQKIASLVAFLLIILVGTVSIYEAVKSMMAPHVHIIAEAELIIKKYYGLQ